MGKVKKNKSHKKSVIPVETLENDKVTFDSKEHAIQSIIDQLQASNIEEKYCGLQTFALLLENPENITQIIELGLIKVTGPLLLDKASSVRNAAAGVLRNLSTIGLETCEALIDHDVMTPLVCYFHEHMDKLVLESNLKMIDEDLDTSIHCLNLLCNLCESSEIAIKYLGQSKILDILPRFLDMVTFGQTLVISILQCLFITVEDNPLASEKVKINAERYLNEFLEFEDTDYSVLLMKTLAAGIIIKCSSGNMNGLPIHVTNRIFSILSHTLSVDHRVVCNQLSSLIPLARANGKPDSLNDKAAQDLEKQIGLVCHMLDAQQISVEIIANICSCEDSEEGDEDDSLDSEELEDEDLYNKSDDMVLTEEKLGVHIIEPLTSMQMFEKTWARAHLPAENVMLVLKEYVGTNLVCLKIHNLQMKALLCVNNMLATLPMELFGGINGVYKIWLESGKLVFKHKSDNLNILESATAVMRAALDKIKLGDKGDCGESNLFDDLALSDIETMLTGIKECQVPEIRSNLIRMIGILALLLIGKMNDNACNVICTITEFILDQAHKENEVWVLAEALDTIVDLYSEDETDMLAAKVKLVDKLMTLVPILKNKIRQQKRLPKEYKVLVSTVMTNLPRFIKYKKDRISKL